MTYIDSFHVDAFVDNLPFRMTTACLKIYYIDTHYYPNGEYYEIDSLINVLRGFIHLFLVFFNFMSPIYFLISQCVGKMSLRGFTVNYDRR